MMVYYLKSGLVFGCFVGLFIMTLLTMLPINRETSKEIKIVSVFQLFVGYTWLGIFMYSLYNSDSIWKDIISVIIVIIVASFVDKFFVFIKGEIVEKERLQREIEAIELTTCNNEEEESEEG